MQGVSIIIPVKNEELILGALLCQLATLNPHEIIVVDGHSSDSTATVAARTARVLFCDGGRGPQMNAGAAVATGSILLFLHADVRPGTGALSAIRHAIDDQGTVGGNLNIVFEGGREAAIFTLVNRIRRRCRIFYGDSGIFCRRDVFEALGGYKPWPVMEDYEFVSRLRRAGKLALLDTPIHVSARRWKEGGLWRTMWTWFWIQSLYLAGVSPFTLARWYKDIRDGGRGPAV
jgi:rSAM/selenodomain-associated transferase 2